MDDLLSFAIVLGGRYSFIVGLKTSLSNVKDGWRVGRVSQGLQTKSEMVFQELNDTRSLLSITVAA